MLSTSLFVLAAGVTGACYEVAAGGGKDFTSIQAAINASANGDKIHVWPGTYWERIRFNGKAVEVVSVRGPSLTTINGGVGGAVVTFDSDEGSGSILNGFTIRNGTGNLGAGSNKTVGGGIAVVGASPTIRNNVVRNNQADWGGGIAVLFGSPFITNNKVESNTAVLQGGGIFVLLANPNIIVNHVSFNTVTSLQGEGGGVYLGFTDQPGFTHNVVVKNSAARGSGVLVDYVSGVFNFDHNTVAHNCSNYNGYGLQMYSQQPEINIQVRYSILWNNTMSCYYTYYSTLDFLYVNPYTRLWYSDTSQINYGYHGNISSDPQFLYPPYDYHLSAYSPAQGKGPSSFYTPYQGAQQFIRGDADSNGVITDNDVSRIYAWLYYGTPVLCVVFPMQSLHGKRI